MKGLLHESSMKLDEIERACGQANGQWAGCDWPTMFGKTSLNLNGLKSAQALLMARATSGDERADWDTAVAWLTRVEQDAREAEEEARRALTLSRSGHWTEALAHAQRSCEIEAKHHHRLVWQPLRAAIEAALIAGLQ